MVVSPQRLSFCALLLLGLSACSSGSGSSGGAAVAGAPVKGEIIYPAQAGQAVLAADIGESSPLPVVTFDVGTNGQYALNLPVPVRLAPAGNYSILPLMPDIALLGFGSSQCTGQTLLGRSTSAARLAVLSGGRFLVGGVNVAQLRPSSYAIDALTPQDLTSTKRFYAYADRAVRVAGNLNCTLARGDGSVLNGQVQVNYDLAQGWNVLTLRTVQRTQPPAVLINAAVDLPAVPVQWGYYPVQ